jgi:hypothetical protein
MTKCVDVYLQNGSYDNGDIVSLYDCNTSKNNQKFVVFADGTIRSKYAQNMCLDASAGVNYGSKIHLWQCHGGANQQFNAGEYDWGNRYYMRIYAIYTGAFSAGSTWGHALMATWRTGRGITNTFSFWLKVDQNYTLAGGRSNNMYSNNSIMVDYYRGQFSNDGTSPKDWDIAYGGETSGFKSKDYEITKAKYDEVRYMRGYRVGHENLGYNALNYFPNTSNCAEYSSKLLCEYTGDCRFYFPTGQILPTTIYNGL